MVNGLERCKSSDWNKAFTMKIKSFITVRGLLHTIFDDYYFMFSCQKESYMHPDKTIYG